MRTKIYLSVEKVTKVSIVGLLAFFCLAMVLNSLWGVTYLSSIITLVAALFALVGVFSTIILILTFPPEK